MAVDKDIIFGKKCPYCGKHTELIDSKIVYKVRSYGMVYACLDCNAWVGVHKGSTRALGRLANAELREWKKKAHAVFDPIWKEKEASGMSRTKARHSTYRWLSEQLNIEYRDTHIGMFDVELCKQTVLICSMVHFNNKMSLFGDEQSI